MPQATSMFNTQYIEDDDTHFVYILEYKPREQNEWAIYAFWNEKTSRSILSDAAIAGYEVRLNKLKVEDYVKP